MQLYQNDPVLAKKYCNTYVHKKPLKTVWPDCKVATKFEKIDREQAKTQWLT